MQRRSNFDTFGQFENYTDGNFKNDKIISTDSLSGFYYGNCVDDGFDSISEIVKLWRAVISQGLSDIRSRSKRSEVQYVKNKIYQMVTDMQNDEYFTHICNMARLSPHIVKDKFKKILDTDQL